MKYYKDRDGIIGVFENDILIQIHTDGDDRWMTKTDLIGKCTWEEVMEWNHGKEITEEEAFLEIL